MPVWPAVVRAFQQIPLFLGGHDKQEVLDRELVGAHRTGANGVTKVARRERRQQPVERHGRTPTLMPVRQRTASALPIALCDCGASRRGMAVPSCRSNVERLWK